MIDWNTIDTTANLSSDFKSLELSKREREALEGAPEDFIAYVDDLMTQYVPLDTPYAIRTAVVMKSVALLLLDQPNIERAITRGYNG